MNKLRTYILSLSLCMASFLGFAQTSDTFSHTVERGETVYSIATMYNVSVSDIQNLNPDSKTTIKAGSVLQIPRREQAIGSYTFHTIKQYETLYAVSKRYHVSGKAIIKANPGLSTHSFQVGKTIRIPISKLEPTEETVERKVLSFEEYKVKRRETMYSLCRKFDVSSSELLKHNPALKRGVKKGMLLRIPITQKEIVKQTTPPLSEQDVNALLTTQPKTAHVSSIKAVLLLPFNAKKAVRSNETERFVEYYEGLLLAVDSLQRQGYSIELSVFDIENGTKKLDQILQSNTLKTANLIIGAVLSEQIEPIAAFAQANNIKYVIPFTSKNKDVLSNACVFQVNTPQSYLYDKAVSFFCNLHKESNVVIVDTKDAAPKTEFLAMLKSEMTKQQIPFHELTYNAETFLKDMDTLFTADKRNVIIPLSGSLKALNKIKSPLRVLTELVTEERTIPYSISLFGYPEWQTYLRECLEDFYTLDTYIYSNFYALSLSLEVQSFYSKYRHWFSKVPMNTYPKYAILGFDTAMYFLTAIHRHGTNFEQQVEKDFHPGLQSGFHFTRVNNWGGYINTNIFSVHFSKDFTITRNIAE